MKHKGCGGNIGFSEKSACVPYTDERTGEVRVKHFHPFVCRDCGIEITDDSQVEYLVSQE